MSSKAIAGYDDSQKKVLNHFYDRIIHSDLETIESHGGGSARCMIMELY
ncbi:MAG: arginine deiminase-related protein [Pseudomonadota bacterium]|nr:arginine deiminase-related protein [Pseudomonadota bacterium]